MKRRFLSHSPSALWRKVSGAAAMPWLSAGRRVRVSAQREAPRPELGNERASGDEAELENGRLPDNGTEYRLDMRAAFRAFLRLGERAFWEPAGRVRRAAAKASGGRRRISGCGFPAHNSCVL